MPHTLTYNPTTRIIEIKVQGTVVLNEFKEIFAEASQLALETKCFLFLSDFREATLRLSTLDIYALPKMLADIAAPAGLNVHLIKRAIVIAPKDTADAQFAETVTLNQGQSAKVFQDIEAAKRWLAEV